MGVLYKGLWESFSPEERVIALASVLNKIEHELGKSSKLCTLVVNCAAGGSRPKELEALNILSELSSLAGVELLLPTATPPPVIVPSHQPVLGGIKPFGAVNTKARRLEALATKAIGTAYKLLALREKHVPKGVTGVAARYGALLKSYYERMARREMGDRRQEEGVAATTLTMEVLSRMGQKAAVLDEDFQYVKSALAVGPDAKQAKELTGSRIKIAKHMELPLDF